MAEKSPQSHDDQETKERGCFDFMTKKKEEKTEDVVMTDDDLLNGSAKESKLEEKHTLLDELQSTHSHSSSSSDEEVEDRSQEGGDQRKKKKKKGLKDTEIMTKDEYSSCVPMEKCSEVVENAETVHTEEKKGFLEKIMGKFPGQHNKVEDQDNQIPAQPAACENSPVGIETKEKKGIIEKIKEKFPGHHKINNGNEVDQK